MVEDVKPAVSLMGDLGVGFEEGVTVGDIEDKGRDIRDIDEVTHSRDAARAGVNMVVSGGELLGQRVPNAAFRAASDEDCTSSHNDWLISLRSMDYVYGCLGTFERNNAPLYDAGSIFTDLRFNTPPY